MSRLDVLLEQYSRQVQFPWQRTLAGPQRVWFVVYDEEDERRIRNRIGQYEIATRDAGKSWRHIDLTDAFPEWMAAHQYREGYFAEPDKLKGAALKSFRAFVVERVRAVLTDNTADADTMVALSGVASLFGLLRVSDIVVDVQGQIKGRLAVFFPGAYQTNTYRLLDKRDGWNYLALPIVST